MLKINIEKTMILIPSGEFLMGGGIDFYENELPQHKVYLDDYYIGIYPVTNHEYSLFIQDGGYLEKEYWSRQGWTWMKSWLRLAFGRQIKKTAFRHDPELNHPDHPIVGISWYEADAYCRWAGARLPTEAEWEKAARGTDARDYPWGKDKPDSNIHCNYFNKNAKTTPVGKYEQGKSPYGCYDMSGNVWEWVYDWYDPHYYKKSPVENPKNERAAFDYGWNRVMRGGSWYEARFKHIRCGIRSRNPAWVRANDTGFRICR